MRFTACSPVSRSAGQPPSSTRFSSVNPPYPRTATPAYVPVWNANDGVYLAAAVCSTVGRGLVAGDVGSDDDAGRRATLFPSIWFAQGTSERGATNIPGCTGGC